MTRVGWHCTACNRYFQTDASEPAPESCRYCDSDTLTRIDHPARGAPTELESGTIVACEILGEVVEIHDDCVLVRATDGTGTYSVNPDQIVRVRSPGSTE